MGEEGVEGLQILGQRGGLILGEGLIFVAWVRTLLHAIKLAKLNTFFMKTSVKIC